MLTNILIAAAIVIIWIMCSGISWLGLKGLQEGTVYDRVKYSMMSTTFRWTLVIFAPIILIKKLLQFLLSMWAYILIIAVIVWGCTLLSGCQVNVVTAPHATFMVDSVTAESIDQGIYERNAE